MDSLPRDLQFLALEYHPPAVAELPPTDQVEFLRRLTGVTVTEEAAALILQHRDDLTALLPFLSTYPYLRIVMKDFTEQLLDLGTEAAYRELVLQQYDLSEDLGSFVEQASPEFLRELESKYSQKEMLVALLQGRTLSSLQVLFDRMPGFEFPDGLQMDDELYQLKRDLITDVIWHERNRPLLKLLLDFHWDEELEYDLIDLGTAELFGWLFQHYPTQMKTERVLRLGMQEPRFREAVITLLAQ